MVQRDNFFSDNATEQNFEDDYDELMTMMTFLMVNGKTSNLSLNSSSASTFCPEFLLNVSKF